MQISYEFSLNFGHDQAQVKKLAYLCICIPSIRHGESARLRNNCAYLVALATQLMKFDITFPPFHVNSQSVIPEFNTLE